MNKELDKKTVEIRQVDFSSPDFAGASAIRRTVFIEEQQVPEEEEWDGLDPSATHLVAYVDGKPVATLRYYNDDGWQHVGRVAVLASERGAGLGRRLMERCLEDGRRQHFARSLLHAQSDKAGFYHGLGYRKVGEEFMEAGIPHFRMELEF